MTSPAFETVRCKSIANLTGTKVVPKGMPASAFIKVIDTKFDNDAGLTVGLGSANASISILAGKHWTPGQTTQECASAIAEALNSNTLFKLKCVASCEGSEISITTLGVGTAMNSYRATEVVVNDDVNFDVEEFTGGSDSYAKSTSDLVGLKLMLNAPTSDLPPNCRARVYINYETSKTKFFKAVERSLSDKIIEIDVNAALVDQIDTDIVYDTSKKLQATVQLAGTNAQGSQVTETISIDETSSFEPLNPRYGLNTFVFSKNAYKSISGWTVVSCSNQGSAKIKSFASGLSKVGSKCPIAKLKVRGNSFTLEDARNLKPSTISQNAYNQRTGFVGSLALRKLL
jgi:hypothetical protein